MKTLFIMATLALGSLSFANRESGGRLQATAVYVEFKSFGSGIDSRALAEYRKLTGTARMNGQVLDETSERRGLEGEVLNCVQLASGEDRVFFIQNLAPVILRDRRMTGYARTSVYVGMDCYNFQGATEQDLNSYVR